MRVLVTGVSSILVASLLASAAPANELTKKGADPEQVICKIERFVGSNLKNRVCKTRAEWKRVADDTKQGMDDRFMKSKAPVGAGVTN